LELASAVTVQSPLQSTFPLEPRSTSQIEPSEQSTLHDVSHVAWHVAPVAQSKFPLLSTVNAQFVPVSQAQSFAPAQVHPGPGHWTGAAPPVPPLPPPPQATPKSETKVVRDKAT
jgi:hypothetical protein